MCGINGTISFQQDIDEVAFNRLRDSLVHRGPDGAGTWISTDHKVALGHRRLSFLDLSESGQQPMCNETGSIWISLNGEIYNYLEIRETLLGLGHQFKSNTDTEVIIHGYEQWGHAVLQRIKGMFALAIWDEPKQQLFLARDRFGIKPLYYSLQPEQFIFGSELKAIVLDPSVPRQVNKQAISDYLCYRYIPSPSTIWQGIYKLEAAHYLVFDRARQSIDITRYWQIPQPTQQLAPDKAAARVRELLDQSVAQHLRSDVPIGSFLSGGYDSSALVMIAKAQGYNTNTFSIGFEQWDRSEHLFAGQVAEHLGVPMDTTIVGKEQLALLDTLVYHYDEPIADISIIPTYMVSQLAAKKVKAVLSGEGADELFGGYTWQHNIAQYSHNDARWAALKQQFGYTNPFVERYADAMAMGRFNRNSLLEVLHPDMHAHIPEDVDWFYRQLYQPWLDPLKAFQHMDTIAFMGELVLTKVDRASMANALEVRVPFLDHELFEAVIALDRNSFYMSSQTKNLLYERIKDGLPQDILDRKKQGFVGPDSYYMDIDFYANSLRDGVLIQANIIQAQALEKLIEAADHWRLWKLCVLEKWWKLWV